MFKYISVKFIFLEISTKYDKSFCTTIFLSNKI